MQATIVTKGLLRAYERFRESCGIEPLGDAFGVAELKRAVEMSETMKDIEGSPREDVSQALADMASELGISPEDLHGIWSWLSSSTGAFPQGKVRCGECGEAVDMWCANHNPPVRARIDRYIVLESCGAGAFADVYKCYDPEIERLVAVKVLSRGAQAMRLAKRDLLACQVNHECVVRVYDVLADEGAIVMEYVEGGSLKDALRDRPEWVRQHFFEIVKDVCGALHAAHRKNIIHRDIKPANVLLTADGRAKVADFGVGTLLSRTGEFADTVAGTPAYMAPEPLSGEKYGFEADVHSLGCMMFEMWTGELPWRVSGGSFMSWVAVKRTSEPKSLFDFDPDGTSDLLNELVGRMISVDPYERITAIDTVSQQVELACGRMGGSPRTVQDLQNWVGAIYGFVNADKSLLQLLSRYFIAQSDVVRAMVAAPVYRKDVVGELLAKQFMWLCAVATAASVTIDELIDFKYRGECPYCNEQVCQCGDRDLEPRERKNARLMEMALERFDGSERVESKSFEEHRAMFGRVYRNGVTNHALDMLTLHALSETSEAMDAVMHLKADTCEESFCALQLELADLVAWFFAFVNYHRDASEETYDLQSVFESLLAGGCFYCHQQPCVCDDPIGPSDWREIIRSARAAK